MEDFLKKHLGKGGILKPDIAPVEVKIGGSTYRIRSTKSVLGDVYKAVPEEIRDQIECGKAETGNYAADRKFDLYDPSLPSPNFNLRGVRTGRLSSREHLDSKSPEAHFREGVRRCVRAGISQERMIEIMNLEIAQYVMEC